MTRDQAKAILENLDLIRHYAEGGDIGHQLIRSDGRLAFISPARVLTLSNMKPGRPTNYVRVKAKFRWNPELQMYERATRAWPERIKRSEVIE